MSKVSTITPCYNMGKYMRGFLTNLSQQTHKDLEVVIDHNDPSETEIKLVTFEDGLLVVQLGKIVPEHHARKDWL